jgi:hypothetical protein
MEAVYRVYLKLFHGLKKQVLHIKTKKYVPMNLYLKGTVFSFVMQKLYSKINITRTT